MTRNLVPGESVYGEKRLVAESADGEDKHLEKHPESLGKMTQFTPCQWIMTTRRGRMSQGTEVPGKDSVEVSTRND